MYFDIIDSTNNPPESIREIGEANNYGFYVGLKFAWNVVSSKIAETTHKISSLVSVDRLAQASIASCVIWGTGTGSMNLAYSGCATALTLWGATKALQGDRQTGAKMLFTALALGNAGRTFNEATNQVSFMGKELAYFREKNAEQDITLDKYRTELHANLEKLNRLDHCEKDMSKAQRKIAKLSSRTFMDYLFGKNEFHDTELDEVKDPQRHVVFGATYIKGNRLRDELSEATDANHAEYAQNWDLEHRIVDTSLVANECLSPKNHRVDCVPYWNKVAVLRAWLNEPRRSQKEEWYILTDDDMPVTNMLVNPYEAIDLLRGGEDTSVIIAQDLQPWKDGDPKLSVNTGILIVRKDELSKKLIDKLWKRRNAPSGILSKTCQTLGTCQNQEVLHEQEALAQIIKENRSLLNRVITVVKQRDTYGPEGQEIALNTFFRQGCFSLLKPDGSNVSFRYTEDDRQNPGGLWKKGDWMGQPTGVPISGWFCHEYLNNIDRPMPVRLMMLKNMIEQVQK